MIDNLNSIPQSYTALAETFTCILYIVFSKNTKLELNNYILIILMGIVQVFLQLIKGVLPQSLLNPMIIANVYWMYLTIKFNTNLDNKVCTYTVLKAFIIAEFMESLVWQGYNLFIYGNFNVHSKIFTIGVIISFILILSCVFMIEKKLIPEGVIFKIEIKEVLIIFVLSYIIYIFCNVGILFDNQPYSFKTFSVIYSISTILNACGILIIFLFQTQKFEELLKNEIDKINNIFNSRQYEKYLVYRENSELIKQKLHDLKYHVYQIKDEENLVIRNCQIDEVLAEINLMSAEIETGNSVLNTLLTNKNIYCIEENIIFTCLVDGKLLDFLDVSDICSIFGNIFDNAIEYVKEKESIEKRQIKLKIIEKKQFIIIKFENYCESTPKFEMGLPITTKEDKQNHGYGLKSVKYTVEKYNGTLTLSVKDNWFEVKILFPKQN